MADDKRAERALKKARPFLDEKIKPKQRLKSLISFLESASDSDQTKFFQEHDYTIYAVAYECFTYRVNRIREKQDRTFSATNKDVLDLFETLSVFYRVLRFSKTKLRQGWQARSIFGVFEVLLATGNHHRLRMEGLRLLLHYLACFESEPRDYVELYSDVIDLNLFDSFPLPEPHDTSTSNGWDQSPLLTDDGTRSKFLSVNEWKGRGRGSINQKSIQAGKRAIHVSSHADSSPEGFPTEISKVILYPSTPATRDEHCELFDEILKNIIDSAVQLVLSSQSSDQSFHRTNFTALLGSEYGTQLRAAFTLLRATYLRVLFPRASRLAGMAIKDGEGFETCPLPILHLLVRFLVRTVLVNVSPMSDAPPHELAAAAMVEVVLGDPVNRLFVHEILSQALMAPFSAHTITRSALYLLATWIFASPDQRHAFLRVAPDEPGIATPTSHNAGASEVGSAVSMSIIREVSSSVMSDDYIMHKRDISTDRAAIDVSKQEHIAFNRHLRRYIHFFRLVFLDKPVTNDDIDAQLSVIRDTLDILRAMTMERHLSLDSQTWECLMLTMLDIQASLLQHPSQSSRMRSSPSIVRAMAETVLVTWIRSRMTKEAIWRRLRADVVACTGWEEYMRAWTDIVFKVTRIMADKVYDFDGYLGPLGASSVGSEATLRQRGVRKTIAPKPLKDAVVSTNTNILGNNAITASDTPTQSSYSTMGRLTRESKLLDKASGHAASTPSLDKSRTEKNVARDDGDVGSAATSGSLPRERDPSHTHRHLRERAQLIVATMSTTTASSATTAMSLTSSATSTSPSELNTDDDLMECRIDCHRVHVFARSFSLIRDIEWWNAENTLWIWKSLLCAIGRVCDIRTPAIHYDATLCLVQVWDALDRIRQNQKFRDVGMPALFDFAPTIFECADMPIEYLDTVVVASGCVCRIMCRRHDQPFSSEYYAHFYRILDKWLASGNVPIMSSILLNSSKIFSLCLPGAHTLMKRFLESIAVLSNKPDIPDSVLSAGNQVVASLLCMQNHYLPPSISSVDSASVNRQDQAFAINANETKPVDINVIHAQPYTHNVGLARVDEVEGEGESRSSMADSNRPSGSIMSKTSQAGTKSNVNSNLSLSPQSPLEGAPEGIQRETQLMSEPESHSYAATRQEPMDRPSIIVTATDSSKPDMKPEIVLSETDLSSQPDKAALEALSGRLEIFKGIKQQLLDTIVQLISSNSTHGRDARTHFTEQLLWNVGIMIFDELHSSPTPENPFIQNCIDVLLDHICFGKPRETSAAADCLSLLAHHYSALRIDPDTAHHVIDRIVFAISDSLQLDERARRQVQEVSASTMIVSVLFRCLVEWLGSAPTTVIANPNIALRVSEVIEEAIHVSYAALEAQTARNAGSGGSGSSGNDGTNGSGNGNAGSGTTGGPGTLVASDSDTDWQSSGDRKDSSAEDREIASKFRAIRGYAENTLIHLLRHIDNFAPIHGAAMLHSLINEPSMDEEEAETHQFFTLNGQIILSFADMQKGSKCRVITRDASGKYVWDLMPFYRSLSEVEPIEGAPVPEPPRIKKPIGTTSMFRFNDEIILMPASHLSLSAKMNQCTVEATAAEAAEHQTALTASCAPNRVPDPLEQLLVRIGETHPDCLKQTVNGKLNSPALVLIKDRPKFAHISSAMDSQMTEESTTTCDHGSIEQTNLDQSKPNIHDHIRTEPTQPQSQRALFQSARLLLSQLGFLTFDYLKDGEFQLLSKTPSLVRDIKGLDRKYSREVLKVAIIYVAPGQEDEYSIFRNSCGSYEYEEFVSSLGWEVDLAKHSGYLGGLERSMVNGGVAPYYCTSTLEIMYHDVTKMPTDPSDPKQLKKKRHIGNDHVHIIWNEHYRDYRWDTIGGDFGNAQISITPLVNGMYAVDTYRDESVRPFGPLQSRSVVTRSALGPLVRATVIGAYRAALFSGQGKYFVEPHPFTSRRENIAVISSRHKMATSTFEKFTEQLLTNGRGGRAAQGANEPITREGSGFIVNE